MKCQQKMWIDGPNLMREPHKCTLNSLAIQLCLTRVCVVVYKFSIYLFCAESYLKEKQKKVYEQNTQKPLSIAKGWKNHKRKCHKNLLI